MAIIEEHYLYPGTLFVSKKPHVVVTVLGSCVALCLYDPVLKFGGINHYQLAFWNGEGLASPKYGNIAIQKLIDKMLKLGSTKKNLKAKVFGGAALMNSTGKILSVGERNITLARDLLKEEGIPIISSDVGGNSARKLKFYTQSGVVMLKTTRKSK